MDKIETTKSKRGRPSKDINPSQFRSDIPINRLRQYREAANLSQLQLAEMLGVRPQSICTAERYGRGLGEKKWYKLALFFKVDALILKGYITEKPRGAFNTRKTVSGGVS